MRTAPLVFESEQNTLYAHQIYEMIDAITIPPCDSDAHAARAESSGFESAHRLNVFVAD